MICAYDLLVERACGQHDRKEYRMLGMFKRTFASSDTKLWKELCVSPLRTHLEYAEQARNPPLNVKLTKSRELKEGLQESDLVLRNKCMRKDKKYCVWLV